LAEGDGLLFDDDDVVAAMTGEDAMGRLALLLEEEDCISCLVEGEILPRRPDLDAMFH
jgi:hypothetical protein